MRYSVQTAVSDGTLKRVVLGLAFIDIAHIHVYRSDNVTELTAGVDYTWDGIIAVNLVQTVPNGVTVTILRRTVFDSILNVMAGGAPFLRVSLDENFKQLLYIAQETVESGVTLDYYRSIDMHGNTILNIAAPTALTDAANKGYVDTGDATLSSRITSLENQSSSGEIAWSYTAMGGETYITPPYLFISAKLSIDGVIQYPGAAADFTLTQGSPYTTINLVGGQLYAGQKVLVYIGIKA